jgi:hypothetical protein
MNSVAEDIKDRLVAYAIGTFAATSGWAIYISQEPTDPDTVVTIYDSMGPAPVDFFDSDVNPVNRDPFQIRVRGTSYLTARAKIDDIDAVLHRTGAFTVAGSARYLDIWRTSSPFVLSHDERQRIIWVVNYMTLRRAL